MSLVNENLTYLDFRSESNLIPLVLKRIIHENLWLTLPDSDELTGESSVVFGRFQRSFRWFSVVFGGFRWFSAVFGGFRRFSV